MMKKLQNEKGYTLLLTLVIITILIIFFSSFTLSAMNQQKQVEKTDENYEVVAIAEMGVEYYRAKIVNIINDQKEHLRNELVNNAKKDNDNPLKQTEKDIIDKHVGIVITNSNALMPALPISVNSETDSEIIFQLLQLKGNPSDKSIKIEVQGNLADRNSSITAEFEIPDDLVVGTPSGSDNYHLFTLPTKPDKACVEMTISPCFSTSAPDIKSINNISMWIEKNSIKLEKDTGSSTNFNSNLFLIGQPYFDSKIIGSNINIYSSKDLKFNNHVDISNSKIEINENLNLNSNSSGNNDKTQFSSSTILANGFTINTSNNNYFLKITSGTKLCFKDKTKVNNLDRIDTDSTSFVYILDKEITGGSGNNTNKQYLSETDFISKCNLIKNSSKEYISNTLNLEEITTSVTYD